MIQAVASHSHPAASADHAQSARGDAFRQTLSRTPALHGLGNAQQLLGLGMPDDADRKKRRQGQAVSVSELSGLGIADVGAGPKIASRIASGDGSSPADAAPKSRTGSPPVSPPQVQPAAVQVIQNTGRAAQPTALPDHAPNRDQQARAAARAQAQPDQPSAAHTATPGPHRTSTDGSIAGSAPAARQGQSGHQGARQDAPAPPRAIAATSRAAAALRTSPAMPQARPSAAPAEDQQETKFAAQLSRGLAAILRQGGGTLTMRLQPEALGELTIRMDMQPGRVGASFEVQSDQARQLLNQNLVLLRSALEARGMDVERLDVRLAQPAESEAAHGKQATDGRQHAGGAGDDELEDHERRMAHWASPRGGAAVIESPERDHASQGQEAPAELPSSLRLWAQQVEAGGARVVRLRLDAVA